ncbi:Leucine-rich repeat protein [Plasmopara halstedii]|uniref:Leucine-rich repeat protein n=1 Tax=Plasmopara halstedii TaxID=4781 RepID=A0A0P1AGT2_PLAHL|nr:Leucine-rich repeat protein [Plasmopara halstedii]CEG40286.1 Leucine-rich repeat protein [Plasmopara halstedii]|eukprot:XP_024576655.1 Leucine-rich repeat protein [Plasmopara halstedii]
MNDDSRFQIMSLEMKSCQENLPRLDMAREYLAAGKSYKAARDKIASVHEQYRQMQQIRQEACERERRNQKLVATFMETRLATCGVPTLNSMNVRIERQRAKVNDCKPQIDNRKLMPGQALDVRIHSAIRTSYSSQDLNLKSLELVHLPCDLIFSTLLMQFARLIRSVNISRNALHELDENFISAFPEIESFNCKENALVRLPTDALRHLRYLRVLNVSGNQLDNLLISLPNTMEKLDACRNRLHNVDNLHTLTSLVTLDLSHNYLQLLPCGLPTLHHLQSLDLSGNRLVTLATRPELQIHAMKRQDRKDTKEILEETQDADRYWRIELDPMTNEKVYFHRLTKRVTRATPKCFQSPLSDHQLARNQQSQHNREILEKFPLGWEILVPSRSEMSTALQFVNHCTNEKYSILPSALDHWEGLEHLQLLILSNNELPELPVSIGKLKRLTRLEVDNNNLMTLPDELFGLEALESLKLNSNQLTTLPSSFTKLIHLIDVDLKLNRLREIPSTIGNLQHLRILDVSSNALEDLPPSLLELKRLEHLYLSGNLPLLNAGFTFESLQCGEVTSIQWQLEQKLAAGRHGKLPPEPQARLIGIGAECWSTNLHINREFMRAIELAKDTHTLSFHWRGMETFELPSVFFNLIHLQELRLSGQKLNVLPAQFHCFSNLRLLELRENRMCMIVPQVFGSKRSLTSIGIGSKLEHLDLRYNRLEQLPETLEKCVRLQVLRLSHNLLNSLPQSMHGLAQTLVDLQLAHNQLTSSPRALSGLKALQRLDLSFNRLETLEMDFSHLLHLQVLRLSGNRLTELPMSLKMSPIQDLSFAGNHIVEFPPVVIYLGATLKRLDMQTNRLERLPLEFGKALTTLADIESDGNPLRSPPAEIMRLGIKVISSYLHKRQERVDELVALFKTLELRYDRKAFQTPIVQHLIPFQSSLRFFTSEHLKAIDRAVDYYVNGSFYLPPSLKPKPFFRRGVDLCYDMVLLTHFQLAQCHHRIVLNELLQLLRLIRHKRWADKTEFRYDLQRPWGRRGELVGVYTIRQSLLFPTDDSQAQKRHDELPSVIDVIKTRTQRGFPSEPFLANKRTLQDVENALREFVGPYGPVGIIHDNVPLRCACTDMLRYGKMHDPCRQQGWTIVSILYTEDESLRREVDDKNVREAHGDLLPGIQTFLDTSEGQKHLRQEVKRIKEMIRKQIQTIQKQLKEHRTELKLLVRRYKRRERESKTKAEVKRKFVRREKLEIAKARVREDEMELKREKVRRRQDHTAFRREVEQLMLEEASTTARQQVIRQQRDKAIAMGWRRPWDGMDGRAFEQYKLEIYRHQTGGINREGDNNVSKGEADSDDNSEISDVSFEGYDDFVFRRSQEDERESNDAAFIEQEEADTDPDDSDELSSEEESESLESEDSNL